MTMRAGRAIKKGMEITNSYVEPQVTSEVRPLRMKVISQDPFLMRQELLKMGKFFHCSCSRWPIDTFSWEASAIKTQTLLTYLASSENIRRCSGQLFAQILRQQ